MTTTKNSESDSSIDSPEDRTITGMMKSSTLVNNHNNNNNDNNNSDNTIDTKKLVMSNINNSNSDKTVLKNILMSEQHIGESPEVPVGVKTPSCDYHCDCNNMKLFDNDDKDSLVGMSASEDEDDAEIRQVVVNGELREIDNTSDLTSSPPPPHHHHHHHHDDCHSNCSSPVSNHTHNSLLSLNSDHSHNSADSAIPESSQNRSNKMEKVEERLPEPAIGCCRLCCPNQARADNDSRDRLSTWQAPPHFIPHYPPTVSSIRNAVSHLTRLDDFNVVKLSHGFFSQVFKVIHFGTKRVLVLKMNKDTSNRGKSLLCLFTFLH